MRAPVCPCARGRMRAGRARFARRRILARAARSGRTHLRHGGVVLGELAVGVRFLARRSPAPIRADRYAAVAWRWAAKRTRYMYLHYICDNNVPAHDKPVVVLDALVGPADEQRHGGVGVAIHRRTVQRRVSVNPDSDPRIMIRCRISIRDHKQRSLTTGLRHGAIRAWAKPARSELRGAPFFVGLVHVRALRDQERHHRRARVSTLARRGRVQRRVPAAKHARGKGRCLNEGDERTLRCHPWRRSRPAPLAPAQPSHSHHRTLRNLLST
jgi:hypothetical protein